MLFVGVVLIAYGIYTLISPEASIGIGDLSINVQDNTDAYWTIGLGLATLVLGLVGGRK